MDWKEMISEGMELIKKGCSLNGSSKECAKCPFDTFCTLIVLTKDTPDAWDCWDEEEK